MPVPQATSAPKADRSLFGFVRILGVGFLWLVVGAFAGRYLFPEVVEKVEIRTVEKVVTKRVEVPVDRIVYRDVVKEVERTVEVPVDRVVFKEIAVPVPMRAEAPVISLAAEPSRWDSLKNGMSKSEVGALLGPAARVTESDGQVFWHYEEKGQGALFVRFKAGGLFGSDKVDLYNGPALHAHPKANAGARLLEMAYKAREGGNAALALVYAQSALSVEPGSQPIRELVRSLLAEIRAQTPPR
jgi:hypothetical protein